MPSEPGTTGRAPGTAPGTALGTTHVDEVEDLDVVIIGAGISGIGAATYLRRELPHKSVVVLEARDDVGGTWDLFRYPGIRSDSDLHTFGYEFKPWRHEHAIADAPLILEYLKETVAENDLEQDIRLRHRVVSAAWSSEDARWTLAVEVRDADGSVVRTAAFRAGWVFAATGYYRYDEGYTPLLPGLAEFQGRVVHPQHWPDDLDHAGKRVVIIGSGATAVTLLPAMSSGPRAAQHVTMLQRTPTFILSMPRVDGLATTLTRALGPERGYAATRFKNIWIDRGVVKGLRTFPRAGRRLIRWENTRRLPRGYDVDKHFNPPYDPWDQRLCLAPDGDFFEAISAGRASVATGTIRRFSPEGVVLDSGEELRADVVVTATGLNLQLFGGVPILVDGEPVDVADSVAYRGMLLSGIPNWAMAIGYTTSSWTLKVSLMCRYFIDLVRHMDAHGYTQAVPVADPDVERRPVMDLQAGYAKRAEALLPKQGTTGPWRMAMSYPEDAKALRGPVFDEHLHLTSGARTSTGWPDRTPAHA